MRETSYLCSRLVVKSGVDAWIHQMLTSQSRIRLGLLKKERKGELGSSDQAVLNIFWVVARGGRGKASEWRVNGGTASFKSIFTYGECLSLVIELRIDSETVCIP